MGSSFKRLALKQMAERGAQVGNKNAAKAKAWEGALRAALAQFENEEAKIAPGQALRRIAEVVVMKAIGGDKDAIKEIGDRLDGKPAQSVALSGELALSKAVDLTDDQLAEIALARSTASP